MYEKFRNIMVSRKGDVDDSHMETISIIGVVSPNKCYKITNDNLIETDTIISHDIICDIEPIHFKIYHISQKWQNKENLTILYFYHPKLNILSSILLTDQ